MANKCGICGADINLMQTQKLADGNCICRKNCRSRGFKVYDYVHGNLPGVKAHLDQVERGTKLWDHYFVPRLKTKDKNQKLTRFGAHLYVAEDIGLVAFTQVDYKILIFGKTTRACVYRIADLRNYKYEEQMVRNGDKTEKKSTVRMVFINTEGMNAFNLEVNNFKEYEKLSKYFDTLFGVQKTLGNAANTWKQQMTAIKDVASGLSAAMRGQEDAGEKAAAGKALPYSPDMRKAGPPENGKRRESRGRALLPRRVMTLFAAVLPRLRRASPDPRGSGTSRCPDRG